MSEKYKAPTVQKAFQILEYISKSEKGSRLSEISRNLKISKSTVHGIAAALKDQGAVFRDPSTKKYSLGMTLFELGQKVHKRIDLKETARPFLEELMQKTRESVFLGVRNRNHAIIVDFVESAKDVKITSPVGTRIPLMAGAIGKVFLSSLTDIQAMEMIRNIGLVSYTDKTIVHPERFLEEVGLAKEKGFAVDDEEYISGVRAVASLIDGRDSPPSAIWVVGFKPSMGEEKMASIARETRHTAHLIGQKIKKV